MDELPDALQCIQTIVPHTHNRRLALFLDYDGTLTPIVSQPRQAVLSDAMRATVKQLAELRPVAIISGRNSVDVSRRVALGGIYYVGNHGFEITAPDGANTTYEHVLEFLPQLDLAEYELRASLNTISGCEVERKHFAIAVHYRNVGSKQSSEVKIRVANIKAAHPQLRLSHGKKILELQPNLAWNKGAALHWLIRLMKLDPQHIVPLYIGDDTSDEDAFYEVKSKGVGVLVAAHTRNTAARYRLSNVNGVQRFLERLTEKLRNQAGVYPQWRSPPLRRLR
jgi:trehalose 6-phosphate phosphatase